MSSRVEQLERDVAEWAMRYERSRQTYAMADRRASAAEAALHHLMKTYTACPCGAWIGQEEERPHVDGCPVGLYWERYGRTYKSDSAKEQG